MFKWWVIDLISYLIACATPLARMISHILQLRCTQSRKLHMPYMHSTFDPHLSSECLVARYHRGSDEQNKTVKLQIYKAAMP